VLRASIGFRVDASAQIGTGHFMRCLTLADGLKERGAQSIFVSRDLPGHLRAMLNDRGHESASLDATVDKGVKGDLAHGAWLRTSQAQDAADTLDALSGRPLHWMVVDHYALDGRWETMLRGSAAQIAAIDDIADRIHDCDLLLDQNLHADADARYRGKVPDRCVTLLGPRFALLRQEFHALRQRVRRRSGEVDRILIFFGGADADNYTGEAVAAIGGLGIARLHADVVMAASHPKGDEIAAQCTRFGFDYHRQTDRMAELIASADLAIGAGGTTTWERCCLGLPTLAICLADNQRDQIAAAAQEGLLYAPESGDERMLMIQRHVTALIENRPLREMMSRAGMRAVDGRGVFRVVDELIDRDLEIRCACAADARALYEWRNDPAVRAVSRNKELIDWNAHQSWFASALTAPDRPILIGLRNGAPVGVVRFDVEGEEAEVSIYLVPGTHPPGEGRSLLNGAQRWLIANRQDVRRLRAEISAGNVRSERLFLRAGYRLAHARYVKRLESR
jgi:UDP-2,4-diacetamido-2,4,6-trideoxy-beta-L-altropyranose hydrolase